jgi:thiaminase/transcriptional activator TenA
MGFTQELREISNPIWQRILSHEFLIEMGKGELPLEKFKYFIKQDFRFLIDVSRGLLLAAGRMRDLEAIKWFTKVAESNLTYEIEALKKLAETLGIEKIEEAEYAPSNYAYTRHLLTICLTGSAEEALVSILPCYWSYQEIGEKLVKEPGIRRVRVYREWAETYVSKEYVDLVTRLRSLVDENAEKISDKDKAVELFLLSSRYEYMFWDMAYKMEKWPV